MWDYPIESLSAIAKTKLYFQMQWAKFMKLKKPPAIINRMWKAYSIIDAMQGGVRVSIALETFIV